MGCYVPKVYKPRLLRKPKLILDAHVNGGACYAKDFAKRMPSKARNGVFDMAVYRYAQAQNGIKPTKQIAFSTVERVRRDLVHPSKVVLHGFMQDKDSFIERCLVPVSANERRSAFIHPLLDHWDLMRRKVRVWVVRRGHQAMFENMLLAKERMEASNRAA